MLTFMPKWNVDPDAVTCACELVFVVDRSFSMEGRMSSVIGALVLFLRSIPTGCKFNSVYAYWYI